LATAIKSWCRIEIFGPGTRQLKGEDGGFTMGWKRAWTVSCAVAVVSIACSSDEHELGGESGSAGQNGGSAGSSPSAGQGGTNHAGTGGTATGGGAGVAGKAGNAGTAGQSGSGTAGSGGSHPGTGGGAGEPTRGGSAGMGDAGMSGMGDAGASGAGGNAGCLESGGTLTTSLCCMSVVAYPDSCAIGACGCSPQNSHEVPVCSCPGGMCFDGQACVTR
jgi:hypothetical protein